MRNVLRSVLIAAALLLSALPCAAQQPIVVQNCGTLPGSVATNTPGLRGTPVIDTNGSNCVTGTATQSAFTPLTPMQSGLTVASSTALTVPATTTYAVVCAYGQAVNYTTDGTTTPTTTSSGVGMQLAAGSCLPLVGATVISNFRAIQQTATATLSVSYFKQ